MIDSKKVQRIFIFGCSFTKYHWPTWADILAYDLDIPTTNLAISGIGNVGIMHIILEADIKHKFSDSDLILINWSAWQREDRVDICGRWLGGGSIFNHKVYDNKFIEQYWSDNNDIVKNASAIIIINKLYKIDYQSHMIDYYGARDTGCNKSSIDGQLIDRYRYLITKLPKFIKFDISNNSQFQNMVCDKHPDVICHLSHAEKIMQHFELGLTESTKSKYTQMQYDIVKMIKQPIYHYRDTLTFFENRNLQSTMFNAQC